MNGYRLALNSHTASELNMSDETYKKSKEYLDQIQTKLNQRKSLTIQKYAGTQPLLSKEGKWEERTLLTQKSGGKPTITNEATNDLSPYINGILVKNHERNLVNVVYSKVNYDQFPTHYQQDLNNDKKPEVITRDANSIYIKYADDAESKVGQQERNYSVITPQLKNKTKKYETLDGSWFGAKREIKLYDENREVKNFLL